jgi:hypothetical protein
MSNTIFPIRKPHFLLLNHTPPSLISSRYICIRPYTFDNFVFLSACKDFGDVGEKPIVFVRIADEDARVCEREGHGNVSAVRGAGNQGEESAFEVGRIPVYYRTFECETIIILDPITQ